jgi:hypothetical protein
VNKKNAVTIARFHTLSKEPLKILGRYTALNLEKLFKKIIAAIYISISST